MTVRRLKVRNCAITAKPVLAVMNYYQIQLEICQIIEVRGTLEGDFDVSRVLDVLGLIEISVISGMSTNLLPNLTRRTAHVFRHR